MATASTAMYNRNLKREPPLTTTRLMNYRIVGRVPSMKFTSTHSTVVVEISSTVADEDVTGPRESGDQIDVHCCAD